MSGHGAAAARGSSRLALALALSAAALGLLAIPGCREHRSEKPPRQFFPDLDDQMKWKPQSQTPFFADGRTMRPRPAGVVAYAALPLDPAWAAASPVAERFARQRADALKEDDAYYRGVSGHTEAGEPVFLDYMPVPVTRELIARGRDRFNIYCAACHGYTGQGATPPGPENTEGTGGLVGRRWATPPANFHDITKGYLDRSQRTGKDGYLFHTIRNGLPNTPPFREDEVTRPDGTRTVVRTPSYRMPPYGHAVNEADAWAIVAYIRVLQATRTGTIDDVPPAEREALLRSRPEPPPPPVKPGDGAAPAGGAQP